MPWTCALVGSLLLAASPSGSSPASDPMAGLSNPIRRALNATAPAARTAAPATAAPSPATATPPASPLFSPNIQPPPAMDRALPADFGSRSAPAPPATAPSPWGVSPASPTAPNAATGSLPSSDLGTRPAATPSTPLPLAPPGGNALPAAPAIGAPRVAAPAAAPAPPAAGSAGKGSGSSLSTSPPPASQPSASPTAVETLLAATLSLPEGESLAGKPMTLLEVLTPLSDRQARLGATYAYWDLVRRVAEYRILYDEFMQLNELQAAAADSALLNTMQAAAATALEAAELAVIEAQHALAEAASLPPSATLPLAADRPHAGTYTTYFDRFFTAGAAPARLRLIDRLLPIERESISASATAVEAAHDAVVAFAEAYKQGRGDLAVVGQTLREWSQQRRLWIDAVYRYNHHIAEYAISVAGPQINSETMVSMLIDRGRGATSPERRSDTQTADTGAIKRAQHLEPQPAPPASTLQPMNGQPALAPPQPALAPQPTLAPPQPTLAPPQPEAGSSGAANTGWQAQSSQTVHWAGLPDAAAAAPAPLYGSLAAAAPNARAKSLAQAVYATREDKSSQRVDLAELVRTAGGERRAALVEAYWTAAQRAAELQLRMAHAQMLRQLMQAVLERNQQPLGPAEMVELEASRRAADASVARSRADLVESQWALTDLAARPLDKPWLLPSTPPHAGAYRLNGEALAPQRVKSWPVRKLSAAVSSLADHLQDLAAVVIAADTIRVRTVSEYRSGSRSVGDLLATIDRQTATTLGFVERLASYNRYIARYVMAVVPASLPADQFVKTLVLVP